MLFATINGVKSEAKPKSTGVCPLCERQVFSKCGEVNVWHWAHYKDENCDNWYEPETKWHKQWKLVFGIENCEVVISKEEGKHIADIVTKEKVVIELQNSLIQRSIIHEREIFYGERMIWVINGIHFKNNFEIYRNQIEEDEEYYHLNNPLSEYYGKMDKSYKNEYYFSWKWCHRSWMEAQRPVFIDFGDDNIFLITSGIGTSSGKCKKITKEKFMQKYGGDYSLFLTLCNSSNL